MKDGNALYQQIHDKLLSDINRGLYTDGKRLPTEMELAERYFVSRITSKKALNQLAEGGVIVRIPGRGSFVKKDGIIPAIASSAAPMGRMIALVMGGYGSTFGLDIVNGAMERAETLDMHLILKCTNNDQKTESRILKSLMASGVAGIIVQPAHGELYNEVLLNAVYSKYPIVMIDRSLNGIDVPFVGIDNTALGKQAVGRLIEMGHTNIALLAMADDHSSSLGERMQGYMEASMDARLAVRRELWMTRMGDRAAEITLMRPDLDLHLACVEMVAKHLVEHPEITAVYATEYIAARASWDAIHLIGKRVPEDISIIGFDYDDSNLGQYLLSHIKQPQHDIGRCAVDIIEKILNGRPQKAHKFYLPGVFIEGRSMAPPIAKTPKLTIIK